MTSNTNSNIIHQFIAKHGTNSTLTFDNALNKIIEEQIKCHLTIDNIDDSMLLVEGFTPSNNNNQYYEMLKVIKKDFNDNIFKKIVDYIVNTITCVFNNTYFIDISNDKYVLNTIISKLRENESQIFAIIQDSSRLIPIKKYKHNIDHIIQIEYKKLENYIYSDICDEETVCYYDNEFNDSMCYALFFLNESSLANEMLKALYVGALGRKVCNIVHKNKKIKYGVSNNTRRNIIDYIYDKTEEMIEIKESPYSADYLSNCNFKDFCENVKENIILIYETYVHHIFEEHNIHISVTQFIDLLKPKLYKIAYFTYQLDSVKNESNDYEICNNQINFIVNDLIQFIEMNTQ
jgi:hypothetical protein